MHNVTNIASAVGSFKQGTSKRQFRQLREAFELCGSEYNNKLVCIRQLHKILAITSHQYDRKTNLSSAHGLSNSPVSTATDSAALKSVSALDKALIAGTPSLMARYLDMDDDPLLQAEAAMVLATMLASGSAGEVKRVALAGGVMEGLIGILPHDYRDNDEFCGNVLKSYMANFVEGVNHGAGGEEKAKEAEEGGMLQRVYDQRLKLRASVLQSLCIIASTLDTRVTDVMVGAGVLSKVVPLLGHDDERARVVAEQILSTMCASGTYEHCKAVADAKWSRQLLTPAEYSEQVQIRAAANLAGGYIVPGGGYIVPGTYERVFKTKRAAQTVAMDEQQLEQAWGGGT
jgi:hypothetical protein